MQSEVYNTKLQQLFNVFETPGKPESFGGFSNVELIPMTGENVNTNEVK